MDILQKSLTYQAFREMEFEEGDNFWYEIINGKLVQKETPNLYHQAVLGEIVFRLGKFVKYNHLGKILYAPLDVVLEKENMYHPDIFFIKKERFFIIDDKEKVVLGAPDLAIEILSKSTAGDDKGEKKDNYEKFGVREYWLVDPIRKSFEIYNLINDRFKLTSYLEEAGTLKSTLLKGFEMDIEEVFSDAEF
ncbi:MAG TPA: Uma2 family endonuclease [Bacteroidetes bacterium]|nr:Uma2 family endonuclease [Bacteroidota bacterium]